MLPIALLFALQSPLPTVTPTDSGDPPGRVARLSARDGTLSFQPSGDTSASSWSDPPINYTLTSGDRLYADRGSRAELEVGDCTVRMGALTDLTIATLTDDLLQLSMSGGSLRVSVYDLSDGDSIEVDTPNGAFLLREPGAYRVDVSDADSTTTIRVDSGLVDVIVSGVSQSVRRGEALQLAGDNPIRVASLAPRPPDDFDRWSAERDQPLAASPSAQYVGRDMPGYDDLDQAGQWETTPDYGPVWSPTVVPEGWAPYRVGHWAWVDPWGWTWIDDAAWGYAPFHYGRWVYWHSRWAWAPGQFARRHCYAPALVEFASAGDAGVQVWFPLGPGEPYHPPYHHGPKYRARVNPNVTVVRSRDVHFVNRQRVTAVSVTAFRGGESVGRRSVPVSDASLARIQVIAHPRVQPLPQTATGGRRIPRPQIEPRPEIRVTPRGNPSMPVMERPVPERPVPQQPAPQHPVIQQPVPVRPVPPTPEARPPVPARQLPPPVIARNPPAPAALPFPTRERAMRADPGRPLEPVQRQNLQQGKPAGPHKDPEDPVDRRVPKPAVAPPPPPKKPDPRRP